MRLHPITLALRSLRGERSLHGRPLPTPADAVVTLRLLTGQDFGIDVAKWGEWLRANRWVYTAQPDQIPLTDAQKQDLQRRLAALDANPDAGSTWDEVKALLTGGM